MEEDIKILEEIEVTNFNTSNIYLNPKKVNTAIRNLINKNKELEKMVDEMAEHIVSSAVVDDTVCAIKFCEIEEDCTYEKMLECTKQYFKKKASEENGNRNDN